MRSASLGRGLSVLSAVLCLFGIGVSLLAQSPSLRLRLVETNSDMLELVMDDTCSTQAYTYCDTTSFPAAAWNDAGVRRGQSGEASIGIFSIEDLDSGFFRLRESSQEDFDGDGLANIEEYFRGPDPENPDSDFDGMQDGWEIAHGFCPTNPADAAEDADGDGFPNVFEFAHGSEPGQSSSMPAPSLYVSETGLPGGDGSQANPFGTIQAAIDAADDFDVIHVAAGVYTGEGNKDLDFQGKPIMVLSASGAATCVIDCQGSGRGVWFSKGEDTRTILRSITIRNGGMDGGAGIRCETSSPAVIDCVVESNTGVGVWFESSDAVMTRCAIQGNTKEGIGFHQTCSNLLVDCTARRNGWTGFSCYDHTAPTLINCLVVENDGGVDCYSSSALTMRNCTVSTNNSYGFYCDGSSRPLLSDCLIENNDGSGLMCFDTSVPTLSNCALRLNEPGIDTYSEGEVLVRGCLFEHNKWVAVYADSSAPVFDGCVFRANEAVMEAWSSNLKLVNCLAVGNEDGILCWDSSGAVILNTAIVDNEYAGLTIYAGDGPSLGNCILWGNGDGSVAVYAGSPVVTYSCVEGGWAGEGNTEGNPLFQPGTYRLRADSPCIDAGTTNGVDRDREGEERWDDPAHSNAVSIVDIGPDEFVDTDGDAMADAWEWEQFGDASGSAARDYDDDGLNDGGEYVYGADPRKADTDDDGLDDGDEVDPVNGTNPFLPDTDGDWAYDGAEVRVFLDPTDSGDVSRAYALSDDDGDDYLNIYELNLWTDPADADSVPAPTVFVDCAATGPGDGSSTNPFRTVQAALEAARPYDIIEVADGTYAGPGNRDLDFCGKPVMLVPGGSQGWVVDCEQAGRGFHFHSEEDGRSMLRGVTIRNGCAARGAGIYVYPGDPAIEDIIIVDCIAQSYGGGLYASSSGTELKNCVLHGNSALLKGGGAAIYGASQLINCTIANNTGGGIECGYGYAPVIQNSIIWGNGPTQIFASVSTAATVTYSCVQGGWPGTGNITTTPAFVRGGWRLTSGSPCIDAGATNEIMTDIDHETRRDDPGHTNSVSSFDMGADEFTDTDGDAMADGWELHHFGDMSGDDARDYDFDGLSDRAEYDNDVDPKDDDSDDDELNDAQEVNAWGTNPLDSDCDDDGLMDGEEVNTYGTGPLNWDSDCDGMPDGWEVENGLGPNNSTGANGSSGDPDGDGLANDREYEMGTKPLVPDTDGDVILDSAEYPVSFRWETDVGTNIYFVWTNVGIGTVYGHLSSMKLTTQQDAEQGATEDLQYESDSTYYASGEENYTTLWRSGMNVIHVYMDTHASPTECDPHVGRLTLYRGVVTNAEVTGTDGSTTSAQVDWQAPCATTVTCTACIDGAGAGGWVRLMVEWTTRAKLDIEQGEVYVCGECPSNVTLNLTSDSYLGGNTVNWESTPAGITGSTTSITFDPSTLSPTTYIVRAQTSPLTNLYDTCLVHVLKIDMAMDGKRDDAIDFDDPDDAKYLFWVNDDVDVISGGEEDDAQSGTANCNDNVITCRRDLEDFTRLHVRVDDNTANLSGMTYWLKFDNVAAGSPAMNLFEAVDTSLDYLTSQSVSGQQIAKVKLLEIGSTEQQLPTQYIKTGNQRSAFLVEGKSAGKGDLVLVIKKDGVEICRKAVQVDQRPIEEFYQKYVVTISTDDEVNPTSTAVGSYTYSPENDEYLLHVHGWNMENWEKDRWTETIFKRLWWQRYKGHVGGFQWPTLGTLYYDRSEFRAWRSAQALSHRITALNSTYSGEIRVLAHSMGNVVMGEALRQLSAGQVHTYIAAQAAIPAHCYDNAVANYWTSFSTPNVYGFYFSGVTPSVPYLNGNSAKAGSMAQYFNALDYALGAWQLNNELKPDLNYHYTEGDANVDTYNTGGGDRFYYDSPVPLDERDMVFQADRYEIFARCAESRARALGREGTVAGFGIFRNLQLWGYDGQHYSHSREFRSNIVTEWPFWSSVIQDGNFSQ